MLEDNQSVPTMPPLSGWLLDVAQLPQLLKCETSPPGFWQKLSTSESHFVKFLIVSFCLCFSAFLFSLLVNYCFLAVPSAVFGNDDVVVAVERAGPGEVVMASEVPVVPTQGEVDRAEDADEDGRWQNMNLPEHPESFSRLSNDSARVQRDLTALQEFRALVNFNRLREVGSRLAKLVVPGEAASSDQVPPDSLTCLMSGCARPATHLCFPCNHFVLCDGCARVVMERCAAGGTIRCPSCRAFVNCAIDARPAPVFAPARLWRLPRWPGSSRQTVAVALEAPSPASTSLAEHSTEGPVAF